MEAKRHRAHFPTGQYATLEGETYHLLRDEIAAGLLAPGAGLVGSRLAAELRVSRITVANALKRLAAEGFVVLSPHKGATVAALDADRLREIFLMRHALENVVMREVAARATPELLARLRDLDARIAASIAAGDIAAYRRLEREFHLSLYTASGLPAVAATLTDLWDRLEPYRGRRYTALSLSEHAYAAHTAIAAALRTGNGEAAAAALHAHVAHGHDRMLRTLHETGVPIPSPAPATKSRRPPPRTPPTGSLWSALASLPDVRRGQGRMHGYGSTLALVACATLCGARSEYAAARWGNRCHPAIREILGLRHERGPSLSTIHRAIRSLDTVVFAAAVDRWLADHGYSTRTATATAPGLHGEELPSAATFAGLADRFAATPDASPWREFPYRLLVGRASGMDSEIAAEALRAALRAGVP